MTSLWCSAASGTTSGSSELAHGRAPSAQKRTLHAFATKTGRARDVDPVAPLAQDLAEWRMARGRPKDGELIIPRPSGGQWTCEDWANRRRRIWRPAAIEAGVTGDLRPHRPRRSANL